MSKPSRVVALARVPTMKLPISGPRGPLMKWRIGGKKQSRLIPTPAALEVTMSRGVRWERDAIMADNCSLGECCGMRADADGIAL
jgi:hypothetical protein